MAENLRPFVVCVLEVNKGQQTWSLHPWHNVDHHTVRQHNHQPVKNGYHHIIFMAQLDQHVVRQDNPQPVIQMDHHTVEQKVHHTAKLMDIHYVRHVDLRTVDLPDRYTVRMKIILSPIVHTIGDKIIFILNCMT